MPRTREQLEQAAAEAAEWLDNLDPDDPSATVEDTAVGAAGPGDRRPGQVSGSESGRY